MIIAGSCYDRQQYSVMNQMILKSWKYAGILYGETDPQYGDCKCPDFFYLDGTWVLIVNYIYADGRKDGRDVVWYTELIKMENLIRKTKGLLDEGKDYYAPQSFQVEGRRISAGWNCHLGQHIAQPGSANGNRLPRKLAVKMENYTHR